MTTPGECFKKQVADRAGEVFALLFVIIILALPFILIVTYMVFGIPALSKSPTYAECVDRSLLITFGTMAALLIDIVYAYIIALPFLKCYVGLDL